MAAAEEMVTGSKEVWRHVASREPRFKSEACQPAWYSSGNESVLLTWVWQQSYFAGGSKETETERKKIEEVETRIFSVG